MKEKLRKLVEELRAERADGFVTSFERGRWSLAKDTIERLEAILNAETPERKCRCGRADCLPTPQYPGIDGETPEQVARERLGLSVGAPVAFSADKVWLGTVEELRETEVVVRGIDGAEWRVEPGCVVRIDRAEGKEPTRVDCGRHNISMPAGIECVLCKREGKARAT